VATDNFLSVDTISGSFLSYFFPGSIALLFIINNFNKLIIFFDHSTRLCLSLNLRSFFFYFLQLRTAFLHLQAKLALKIWSKKLIMVKSKCAPSWIKKNHLYLLQFYLQSLFPFPFPLSFFFFFFSTTFFCFDSPIFSRLKPVKSSKPDPYVKLYILPDPSKKSKKKTKVVQGTLTPKFQETFEFQVGNQLKDKR